MSYAANVGSGVIAPPTGTPAELTPSADPENNLDPFIRGSVTLLGKLTIAPSCVTFKPMP